MQGTPTVLIARTDADSATLLTSDIDDGDKVFCTGERTPEGFFKVTDGVKVRRKQSPPLSTGFMPCTFDSCLPTRYSSPACLRNAIEVMSCSSSCAVKEENWHVCVACCT